MLVFDVELLEIKN